MYLYFGTHREINEKKRVNGREEKMWEKKREKDIYYIYTNIH